ncbi:hypothetical protein GGF31_001752 [Allomyces arbusculus]|nr:hypothetical protein GGF31_001752 [Allomyces arbusculus]
MSTPRNSTTTTRPRGLHAATPEAAAAAAYTPGMVALAPSSTSSTGSSATILCCSCGTPIAPNSAAMCTACLANTVNITEGIQRSGIVHWCKNCNRYLSPPAHWVRADLESRELLALLLKRLRGLNKVKLIDAGFVWTEPHSKRVKVKLTIQKEVLANTLLQQTFVVEFVIANQQCGACTKVMAENTWLATVQVRQKVQHKRSMMLLEQLILKHNMHKDTINVKETREGLDFFFASKSHAQRFCDFLASVMPIRTKSSDQLISADVHTSTSNSRYTISAELVPICKDDLVCLPKKMTRALGGVGQLLLCTRVANTLTLTDPNTLQAADIASATFWRAPFTTLRTSRELTEYYVIDVEPSGTARDKYLLADIQVGRAADDAVFWARSHLGNILHVGDLVMGYDLTAVNFNSDDWDALEAAGNVPDVVLVKKSYPPRKRNRAGRMRPWKLKQLAKVAASDLEPKKNQLEKTEADYEAFLRDIEEDPELRAAINLYKDPKWESKAAAGGADGDGDVVEEGDEDEDDDDVPEVALDELLDDMSIASDDDDDGEGEDGGEGGELDR